MPSTLERAPSQPPLLPETVSQELDSHAEAMFILACIQAWVSCPTLDKIDEDFRLTERLVDRFYDQLYKQPQVLLELIDGQAAIHILRRLLAITSDEFESIKRLVILIENTMLPCYQLLVQRLGHARFTDSVNMSFFTDRTFNRITYDLVFCVTLTADSADELAMLLTLYETILETNYKISRRARSPLGMYYPSKLTAQLYYDVNELTNLTFPYHLNLVGQADTFIALTNSKIKYSQFSQISWTEAYRSVNKFLDPQNCIVVVTSNALGSGNYMHARHTIKKLTAADPNLKVIWFIELMQGVLPEIDEIANVQTYHTVELWEMFPLISYCVKSSLLSLSVLNPFWVFYHDRFDMQLAEPRKPILSVVEMSHRDHYHSDTAVEPLPLGIPSEKFPNDIGILKPDRLPAEFDNHKTLGDYVMAQLPLLNQLKINLEHPTFFGYLYVNDKGKASGIAALSVMDVLALFVVYALELGQTEINIFLPVSMNDVNAAIVLYPNVFKASRIRLANASGLGECSITDKPKLIVNIINPFPIANTVFRALIELAMKHQTPVAVTGDQSFFELFFSNTQQFVFMYQVLDHKKVFLNEMMALLLDNKLNYTHKLLSLYKEFGVDAFVLNEIVEFIVQHRGELNRESQQLAAIVHAAPDSCDKIHARIRYYQQRAASVKQPAAVSASTLFSPKPPPQPAARRPLSYVSLV